MKHTRGGLPCSSCDKVLTEPSLLKTHMSRVHGKKSSAETPSPEEQRKKPRKMINCPTCGKMIRPQYLKKHLITHFVKRDLKCYFCGEMFNHSSLLEGHFRIHTGEKPFFCHLCPKTKKEFGTNGELISHLRLDNHDINQCALLTM